MTTLMNERVAIGSRSLARGSGSIKDAIKAWKEYDHDDPALRDVLIEFVDEERPALVDALAQLDHVAKEAAQSHQVTRDAARGPARASW